MRYHAGVVLVSVCALLAACDSSDTAETNAHITTNLTNRTAKNAIQYFDMSVDLAQMNGCWACHRVERGQVGPSWRAVSKHYKDDPNAREWLFHKIKKGGAGVWTETTSGAVMPPYSPRVTDEHINQLIDFILSLERDNIPQRTE